MNTARNVDVGVHGSRARVLCTRPPVKNVVPKWMYARVVTLNNLHPKADAFTNTQSQLHRQIIVLLARPFRVLGLEHGERARNAPPRFVRLDHLVDIAALGRDERR